MQLYTVVCTLWRASAHCGVQVHTVVRSCILWCAHCGVQLHTLAKFVWCVAVAWHSVAASVWPCAAFHENNKQS